MPDTLRAGVTRVTACSTSAFPESEIDRWILSGERERAAGPMHPLARARFLAGRALLRRECHRLFRMDPEALILTIGPQGKPHFAKFPEWHFNLSHAGDLVVLALSRTGPVGVDIERLDRRMRPAELSARYFSPAEREHCARHDFRPEVFLRIWNYKEALLKAEGLGITVALADCDTAPYWNGDRRHPRGWRLLPLDPAPGFSGALATPDDQLDWVPPS